MDCICRAGTRAVLGCSVSTELLLGLYCISRTDTWAVADSIVPVGLEWDSSRLKVSRQKEGLVLGHFMTMLSVELVLEQKCSVAYQWHW